MQGATPKIRPHKWTLWVDIQLHLLKQRFRSQAKVDAVWCRGKTLHSWIWGIMKKLHYMPQNARSEVLNRIIGDYKKYSLNPSVRAEPANNESDSQSQSQCESDSQSQSQSQPEALPQPEAKSQPQG